MYSNPIHIANFNHLDSVTYSIIKIIGKISVEFCQEAGCQNVLLFQNDNTTPQLTKLINNHFQFLLELSEGRNNLKIKYCDESVTLDVDYIHSKSEYAVIPLYVICEGHDGLFQAPRNENNSVESACKRITLCAKLLQCVTAEKLYENSFGRKTFHLNDCVLFRSKLNYLEARKMTGEQLWKTIGREIMKSSIGSETKKFLAFLSCTKYRSEDYSKEYKSHEDLLRITEGYVALGGGGLALFGTACLHTWAEVFEDIISRFEDTTVVDRSQFLDDSCYRGTFGACFSTTLGSVLHELFHTFDLGHTDNGIMGRGFDNIREIFLSKYLMEKSSTSESLKTFYDRVQFNEELEPGSLSERLLTQNKYKGFTVIKKLENVGDTVLEKSCAVLLSYHKWFNKFPSNQSSTLSFDNSFKIVRSTAGIRVIELRSPDTEMVLYNWVFTGKVLKFSFQIPEDTISSIPNQIIVVEDSVGNIIKENIF